MSLSLKYRLCPHCSRSLNIKTFKEHKRLFYCEQSGSWMLSNKAYDSGSDSSDISIEPGEASPEALCEDTMNDELSSSDMDMSDEAPDGTSQPLTFGSDCRTACHGQPSVDAGMSYTVVISPLWT